MFIKPLLCRLGGVFRIIVMLKENILHIHIIPVKGLHQLITKDSLIKLRVEPSIDATEIADTLGGHASPDHNATATVLDSGLHMVGQQWLPRFPPAVFSAVGPKNLEFA